MDERIDTVIIGGGHAGLTMSYFLSQRGREHVILERGRVGERWRSERWILSASNFPTGQSNCPATNTNATIQKLLHRVGRSCASSKTTRPLSKLRRVVEWR